MGLANLSLMADLMARQCVMASMLYYGLDVNMMPDHEYDKASLFVAEHYKLLSPLRQWMVGKPEEIRSSGYQCRVTKLAADASVVWMIQHKVSMPSPLPITIARPWRLDKRQGLNYLNTSEFRWRDV